MNYAQIRKHDIANGPGIRTTLFVSGCTHYCKDCFNSDYWNFNYGSVFTKEVADNLIEMIKETGHFSLLGGEPFMQDSYMLSFLRRVKAETDADIWAWSGFTLDYLMGYGSPLQMQMVELVDVLVDGKFEVEKKDITLSFRGSSNQRILDVRESIRRGMDVRLEEYIGR